MFTLEICNQQLKKLEDRSNSKYWEYEDLYEGGGYDASKHVRTEQYYKDREFWTTEKIIAEMDQHQKTHLSNIQELGKESIEFLNSLITN